MKSILLCCLLAGLACASDMEITLDMSETGVHPGTEVTFVCKVTNMDPSYSLWWFKAVIDSSGPAPYGMQTDDDTEWETNEHTEQIALNEFLVDFYEDLADRYSVTQTSLDDSRMFTLNMKNVTDGETGFYGCVVLQDKTVYVTKMFEVYEAPNEIHFENVTSNITLTEGEKLQMGCHVMKSVPAPIVTMSIGHESGGFKDITQQFDRDTEINFNCMEATGGSDKTCPLNMDFSVSLDGVYKPHYRDNKKFLTCTASYPEWMDLKSVSTDVEIIYEYAPKFECGTTATVLDTDTKTVLECKGFANPAPTNAFWEFTISGKKYEVPFNGSNGDFKGEYNIIDPGFGPVDDITYKLTISNLNYAYLTSYKLKVVNSIGPNSTSIKVTEKQTGGGTDAASDWVASPILLLAASLLALIKY